jgi:hypothetical protein
LAACTFAWFQERIRQGQSDEGGDGKNEERKELALIIDK